MGPEGASRLANLAASRYRLPIASGAARRNEKEHPARECALHADPQQHAPCTPTFSSSARQSPTADRSRPPKRLPAETAREVWESRVAERHGKARRAAGGGARGRWRQPRIGAAKEESKAAPLDSGSCRAARAAQDPPASTTRPRGDRRLQAPGGRQLAPDTGPQIRLPVLSSGLAMRPLLVRSAASARFFMSAGAAFLPPFFAKT